MRPQADLIVTTDLRNWPREKFFYHELENGSVQDCVGYNHQLHGFGAMATFFSSPQHISVVTACALAEASYLNRTLLFSDKFCMPAWHQIGGTDKDLWRPLEEVFNISSASRHGRIELHPDPSAFVQQLTPGSSVMYLRDEILTEVDTLAL